MNGSVTAGVPLVVLVVVKVTLVPCNSPMWSWLRQISNTIRTQGMDAIFLSCPLLSSSSLYSVCKELETERDSRLSVSLPSLCVSSKCSYVMCVFVCSGSGWGSSGVGSPWSISAFPCSVVQLQTRNKENRTFPCFFLSSVQVLIKNWDP